jgi:hypothetical protein
MTNATSDDPFALYVTHRNPMECGYASHDGDVAYSRFSAKRFDTQSAAEAWAAARGWGLTTNVPDGVGRNAYVIRL